MIHLTRALALAGAPKITVNSVAPGVIPFGEPDQRVKRLIAKTPAGLALRIAQRILALTLGILLNRLSGRPARALAAYDGR